MGQACLEDTLGDMEKSSLEVMCYQLDRGWEDEPFCYLMAAGVKN